MILGQVLHLADGALPATREGLPQTRAGRELAPFWPDRAGIGPTPRFWASGLKPDALSGP